MTDVSFYLVSDAMTPGQLDAVLPRLLEKILAAGHRVVLRCPDEERLQRVDELLWREPAEGFLPHAAGTTDETAAELPVYLTTQPENPTQADVLVRLAGAPADDFAQYLRVVDIFSGTEADRTAGRERWRTLKDKGYPLAFYTYENGRWQKKDI